jgi:tRNA(Ile)-lysidine synthase
MGHPNPNPAPNDLPTKIRNAPWLVMNASVDRLWFLSEPMAVQRRLMKAVGEKAGIPLEFKHVEKILRFAHETGGGGKELSLPLGWKLERSPHELIFLTPDLRQHVPPEEYQYELTVPGRVNVNEVGTSIEARRVPGGEEAGYNPEHLLDAGAVTGPLQVRNWRPGDRYWPAHTKSPKKIKELLQERHVAQPERKLWPVVVSGPEIIWLRGFPPPAKMQAKPGQDAVAIVESLLLRQASDDEH